MIRISRSRPKKRSASSHVKGLRPTKGLSSSTGCSVLVFDRTSESAMSKAVDDSAKLVEQRLGRRGLLRCRLDERPQMILGKPFEEGVPILVPLEPLEERCRPSLLESRSPLLRLVVSERGKEPLEAGPPERHDVLRQVVEERGHVLVVPPLNFGLVGAEADRPRLRAP